MTSEIPSKVRATCRAAARYARVAVRCPRLVPDIPIERRLGYGSLSPIGERRAYTLTFNNAGRLHWIIGGGSQERVRRYELKESSVSRRRRIKEGGITIDLYRFREFPRGSYHGGHVGAFIQYGSQVVFATVHGVKHTDVAVAIARSMLPRALEAPP